MRAEHLAAFQKSYDRLNAAQRQAVDTIEGPLMVLAGPGTGKTEVVGVRVGNILRKTQARPSNILCLTFSTSGATAMRERLRRLIGPDAYGVTVTTIHGFCNDIILSHPELFAERRLEEQATDVRRFRLLNGLIDHLPASAVMVNPKDPYARTADILTRISQCKREGVTVARVREVAELYAVEMATKSKPGTKVQARNEKMAQQCREFAQLYAEYEEKLHEEGLFDYDDMIAVATDALKTEDWLLAGLQERYQYVIVDEYQDTNGAQNALIRALTTTPEAAGEPNLCVVGDDDQAIYRFQGANISGMLQFRERFPACPIVVLQTSFRSTQTILDTATRLIAENSERLVGRIPGVHKDLQSGLSEGEGPAPRLLRPVSDAVEPFNIAEWIEERLRSGQKASEIAVFTRKNGELFTLYEVLRGRGIPAQITGKLNLLHHTKVLQTIALLRAVDDLRADHNLASALSAACFGCHPADLARLWTLQREMSQAKRSSDGMSLRIVDVLADIEHRPEAQTFHALERLLQARDLLLDLKGKTDTLTLPELAERLMKESGLIPSDPNATDPLDLMALTEFFDHIKSRGYEDPRFSLGELLVDLEYRQQYGLKLQYDVPHLVDDGIQLMTAHGSKGLEFDTVIVMNFREKHWDHRRPMPGLALPEELLFGGSLAEGLEDERRLAYVAWTRARRELILSCPERMVRGEREQDCSPSAFAIEGGPLIEELTPLREPIRANVLTLPQTKIDGALASFLRSKLEKFELSVTALNHFLEDPQIFLAQDLLGLPQAKSATLSYGTAVHEGLREWARVAKDTGVSSEEALLEGFKTAMTEREILTETERRRLVHLGEKALPRYFAARLQTAPIIWATEKRLTARLGDIRLKGLIDRLDLYHIDGAKVRVIDYKTGSPKSEREIREEESGNLYRQLVFYKLLIERAIETLGYEPMEFSLEFIGERDVEPSSVTFEIPTADVTALESVIEKVWAKIMALDFTPLDGEILPS